MESTLLSPEDARKRFVAWHGLARARREHSVRAVRTVLRAAQVIQLDPLDPHGTNVDLVVGARVRGLTRYAVYDQLEGHAFEHVAKERCLIPADLFPAYRSLIAGPEGAAWAWRRVQQRVQRLPEGYLSRVFDRVAAGGPVVADELDDGISVQPLDWSGWKSTSRATAMALGVLVLQCRLVVSGRRGPRRQQKVFDLPERALGARMGQSIESSVAVDQIIKRRVEAGGLVARSGLPIWSLLDRKAVHRRLDELVIAGELARIVIDGPNGEGHVPYYASPSFLSRRADAEPDDEMRVLGPLDAFLWDRRLVRHLFDYDYVWEVYKPAAQRRWGWYVCPLLYLGRLVGRLSARVRDDRLVVDGLWRERGAPMPAAALDDCLKQLAASCGVSGVERPRLPR